MRRIILRSCGREIVLIALCDSKVSLSSFAATVDYVAGESLICSSFVACYGIL
jgi:hypothetical protein